MPPLSTPKGDSVTKPPSLTIDIAIELMADSADAYDYRDIASRAMEQTDRRRAMPTNPRGCTWIAPFFAFLLHCAATTKNPVTAEQHGRESKESADFLTGPVVA